MLTEVGGYVRALLRRRSTYLVLLFVVVLLVLVPVVRVPQDEHVGSVGELHALVYALERAHASGKATVEIPAEPSDAAWARAAGETDITVWRASARSVFSRKPVVAFSKSYCGYSRRAKDLLATFSLKPAPFIIELDLRDDGPAIQDLLRKLTGRGTVPNVIVGGESIGGADDITSLHAAGRLAPVLNKALAAAKKY